MTPTPPGPCAREIRPSPRRPPGARRASSCGASFLGFRASAGAARVRKSEASKRTRPAQHAERPKGVPAARLAGAAFHLEVHRTRMRILERPSPCLVTLLRHQIDRLGD